MRLKKEQTNWHPQCVDEYAEIRKLKENEIISFSRWVEGTAGHYEIIAYKRLKPKKINFKDGLSFKI